MGVLTRYLIRVHIGPFLFALSAITAVIFLNSVSQRLGDLLGKGLHWTVIAEFLVLSLPHVIALALPMSVLVAVLYAFSDLASSNEITALAAGGIRPMRMLAPVLGLGAVAAGVMLYFNDTILPDSNHELKNLILDIGRKSPTLDLREQIVNELEPGDGADTYFLTADRIDHEASTLSNVTIFDANDPERLRTTYAASGEMAFNDARTDLYLTLYDGVVHQTQEGGEGSFQRTHFVRQIIPLRGIGNELDRRVGGTERGDREMSFAMLAENARAREAQLDSLLVQNREEALRAVRLALDEPSLDSADAAMSRPEDLARTRNATTLANRDRITQLTVTGTRSRAARADALRQSANRFKVETHKKLALAFACLVFTLIGPPLALRFPRGGVGLVVAASSVIFSVYWVGLIAGESLADRQVAGPAVAMWMSNVIFLAVGLLLAVRMGATSGNTRGGGGGFLGGLLGRRSRTEARTG